MKTIQITISDFDEKVLKDEVPDIQEWAQNALDGKINKVKIRLSQTAQSALFKDPNVESIPATLSGSISLYFQQSSYQNAEQRISASLETN
jgi:hypothetical protein